ncbi:MAG: shikimate dehydrogenase [Aquidulcibacter sp.]|jgi:shikimate dehydrogenase|uniref:shikimate dehydrogenase n=1 Tax=Aquidulcibacter sp. TaxID=2052990 RepID=UPI0022C847F1|nr:shikimate dehydrogenase [Aquidulcibacter sp.]MCE2890414.1 shikimate dehydrogenase [Hyphomonadaceae bacterium]MCZ8206977.1 shikimate dehydrogenase [Aquidulcibacter sp.]
MKTTGSTELYAVLGNPVRHSMSPVLQNAWIQAHGFKALYVALPVEPDNFEVALQGLAASDVCGLNITTPFKERAAAAALRQSDRVKLVGAANCLTLDRAGRGYDANNTDGDGLVADLDARASDWRERAGQIVVLGAGGAARSILAALSAHSQKPIHVINRDQDRAQQIANQLNPEQIQVGTWQELPQHLADASLVINATSQGLNNQSPFSPDFSPTQPDAVIYDTIYSPRMTAYLESAKASKRRYFDGLGMLAGQGALAFQHWFGALPDIRAGLKTLEEAFAG